MESSWLRTKCLMHKTNFFLMLTWLRNRCNMVRKGCCDGWTDWLRLFNHRGYVGKTSWDFMDHPLGMMGVKRVIIARATGLTRASSRSCVIVTLSKNQALVLISSPMNPKVSQEWNWQTWFISFNRRRVDISRLFHHFLLCLESG